MTENWKKDPFLGKKMQNLIEELAQQKACSQASNWCFSEIRPEKDPS